MQYKIKSAESSELFVQALPALIQEILLTAGEGACLSGGAVRSFFDGTPVKDYDIFFFVGDSLFRSKELILSKGGKLISENIRVATYKVAGLIVDLCYDKMNSWRGPIDVMEQADFCCNKASLWEGVLIYHVRFLSDIKNRILAYTGSDYAADTFLNRIPRYQRLGYIITDEEKKIIIKDIKRLETSKCL